MEPPQTSLGMVDIMYGSMPRPFVLYSTRRYEPEELQERAERLFKNGQRLFLRVENHYITLAECDIPLASAVAASYHNQICYNIPSEDYWINETSAMEDIAKAHMEDPISDDDAHPHH